MGLPVDILSKSEVLKQIESWMRVKSNSMRLLVTAYSEFFVIASRDKEFARILNKADMVTADGRSVLAAVTYGHSSHGNVYKKLVDGLKVGGRLLKNDLGETVTGVWLFEELARMAEIKGWKVFVLGGWNKVSERATKMLLERLPRLQVEYDAGENRVGEDEQTNERVIKKINNFKPDLLFVSYNPVKQEKWLWSNRDRLKVGLAMGIGGTLDEFVGDLRLAPAWMENLGLKWLWRLILQPSRWRRIVDAIIVFPWLVFRESLKK